MPLRSLKSASGEIAAQRPMCGRNGNCSPSFFPSLLLSCTLFTTTRCSFLHLLFVRPFDVRPKQTQDFFEAFSLVRKQQHRSASGGGDGLAHTAEQTMHFDAMGPSFLPSFDPSILFFRGRRTMFGFLFLSQVGSILHLHPMASHAIRFYHLLHAYSRDRSHKIISHISIMHICPHFLCCPAPARARLSTESVKRAFSTFREWPAEMFCRSV